MGGKGLIVMASVTVLLFAAIFFLKGGGDAEGDQARPHRQPTETGAGAERQVRHICADIWARKRPARFAYEMWCAEINPSSPPRKGALLSDRHKSDGTD